MRANKDGRHQGNNSFHTQQDRCTCELTETVAACTGPARVKLYGVLELRRDMDTSLCIYMCSCTFSLAYFSPLSFLCPIHFCLLLFGLIVIVLSFLFQMFLFSNETASKGVYLGGWVGRWGRSGRSWRRRNCNQNVLYKTLFSIKNENH